MSWSSVESDESDKYRNKYKHDRDRKSSHNRKRRYSSSPVESYKKQRIYDNDNPISMLTFKQFLATQDDGIGDSEAKVLYDDYKDEYQKKVVLEFFQTHKNQDWFRQKYHPKDSVTHRDERLAQIQERLRIFQCLTDNDWLVSLESRESGSVEKFLDAVVTLLEGGSSEDLEILRKTDGTKENGNKKPMHRHQSLSLRSITPDISKKEVEALGRQYEGFLRCSLHDPQLGRRWLRYAWLTFDSSVNIKETCWSVNQLRLKDCELSAVIDHNAYADRVRVTSANCRCIRIVRTDIRVCAGIIAQLDNKWGLWTEYVPDSSELDLLFESKNPYFNGLEDYIVDSVDFDRLERLNLETSEFLRQRDVPIVVDKQILNFLDRLILYLRVVYSIDYYKGIEYENEDEMPCKCLSIHIRPTDCSLSEAISENVLEEWVDERRKRVSHLFKSCKQLSEEEVIKLGLRDEESAVKKFLDDNTQELAHEKFLCPLSGKKFKGPEFVHKHILNKYGDKITECKEEVVYFNNYLRDPLRSSFFPQSPVRESVRDSRSERRRDDVVPVKNSDPRPFVDYSSLAPCDLFEF